MTNIEIRVRGIYDDLSNSEKKVASYFTDNINRVFSLPIAILAEESGVSQVSWVRFCKSIGFAGLKDLKRCLYEELHESIITDQVQNGQMYTDIKNLKNAEQIIATVQNSTQQAISDTLKLLDVSIVEKIAKRIVDANSVKLFGVGASALIAEDFFNKLLRIGKNVSFCRDNHIQLTYAANAVKSDIAVFFSNSGLTSEINECHEIAKKNGCTTIAVTRFGKSPLALGADLVLYTSSPEVYRRSGAMSSRIAQLVLVDILFTAIASRDYKQVESCLEKSYQSCNRHKIRNDT